MSLPVIRQEGDSLVFEWDIGPARVQAEVEEVHHESSGWHAEIQWLNLSDEVRPLISAWKHINLSSPTTVKSHAKSLQEITGFAASWDQMIEQIAARGIADKKKGQEFVKLSGSTEPKPKRYLVDRILEENQVSLFYGESGSCKSYLALAVGLSVQGGYPFLGLQPQHGNVLYLDYETDAEEFDRRIGKLCRGNDLEWEHLPEINYRRQVLALADDLATIHRYIAAEKISLVIIDSLGGACGGEPDKAETALRFYGAVRQLSCTVLGVHHITGAQMGERGKRRPFGSIYHVNIPRSLWELRSAGELESDVRNVAMYHRWSNNGRLWRPFGFEVVFDDRSVQIKRSDMMTIPELAAGTTQKEQILALLKAGAQFVPVIADRTGIPENQVRAVLSRYKRDFQKDGERWGLPYVEN